MGMLQNSLFLLPPSPFFVEKERMSSSISTSQESMLEIKQKLLCTILELESAKTEAEEEMMRSQENIKQLLQLLKIAYLERDEARGQLQSLQNNGSLLPLAYAPVKNSSTLPHARQPVSLPPETTKSNSYFKNFDEFSGDYSYFRTTPLDSLLDAILPPQDLHHTQLTGSRTMGSSRNDFDYEGSALNMSVNIFSSETGMMDRASAVIDQLVKRNRKPLPQKGGFLKAVMGAGPLLQTLLLAGPLPRWQNPPQMQNWQIPVIPIPTKEGAACLVDQKPAVNSNSTSCYLDTSHGFFQNSVSSMSSSAQCPGSFQIRGCPSSDGADTHVPSGKRRRV